MASLHSHSFYEIICCTEGGAQYLLGTSQSHIVPGDVLIIPPGVSHRRLPLKANLPYMMYGRYGIWFNAAHLNELGKYFPGLCLPQHASTVLRIQETEFKVLEDHLSKGWQEREKETPLGQAAVYGEMILFLTELCRVIQNSSRETLPTGEKKTDFLEEIARLSGFPSYSNFYRVFLKEYGIAPSSYRILVKGYR